MHESLYCILPKRRDVYNVRVASEHADVGTTRQNVSDGIMHGSQLFVDLEQLLRQLGRRALSEDVMDFVEGSSITEPNLDRPRHVCSA